VTRVAFVSGGRLQLFEAGRELRSLESPFAEDARERALSIARRAEWKRQGTGASFMGVAAPPVDAQAIPIHFAGIARGPQPGSLVYAIDTEAVTGVFRRDLGDDGEQRLFHSNLERLRAPAARPGEEELVGVLERAGGARHVALLGADRRVRELTAGDTIDETPAWVPGTRAVVYASRGIGRDEAGQFAGVGRSVVHRLELDSGRLETPVDDPEHDLLCPRADAHGALYALRRPWVPPEGIRPSPLRLLTDFLLFPMRLAWAVMAALNIFALRNTGKPLVTAGGARQEARDVRQALGLSRLLRARDDADRRAAEAAPTTPETWVLVRIPPDGGAPEILARRVSAYDVAPDGTVVWADGRALHRRHADGRSERLCEAPDPTSVVVLG
jgi:hypothetical protein